MGFAGVKVFSATLTEERLALGDRIGSWLAQHPELRAEHAVAVQSSCAAFHCLTIVVFYSRRAERDGSFAVIRQRP